MASPSSSPIHPLSSAGAAACAGEVGGAAAAAVAAALAAAAVTAAAAAAASELTPAGVGDSPCGRAVAYLIDLFQLNLTIFEALSAITQVVPGTNVLQCQLEKYLGKALPGAAVDPRADTPVAAVRGRVSNEEAAAAAAAATTAAAAASPGPRAVEATGAVGVVGASSRGLHAFTFQLNLSRAGHMKTPYTLPTPPYHGLHNPYAHPLSHTHRSS